MFKVHYETSLELTKDDMKCLFCTIGQGSYWCEDVTFGNIPMDSEGCYIGKDWEWEGCAAWANDFSLDDPITGFDREDEEKINLTIKDLLTAINKISSNKTSIHWDYASQIANCFRPKAENEKINMSLVDAELADMIFQVACFGDTVYG